jgi:hypothetical protein
MIFFQYSIFFAPLLPLTLFIFHFLDIPCTLRSIPAILAKLNEEGGVSQLVPIYEGSFHSLYGFVMRRHAGVGSHHRPTTSSSFSQSLVVGSPQKDNNHHIPHPHPGPAPH